LKTLKKQFSQKELALNLEIMHESFTLKFKKKTWTKNNKKNQRQLSVTEYANTVIGRSEK